MDQEIQFEEVPAQGENPDELENTVSWVLNVVFKVGAGYLVRAIMEALGF